MCLILFSYKNYPGYRLVLAANRDEFLARPTAPLDYHYNGEQILCGKDLRSGGTWLAVGSDGRMGAITNFRDPARVNQSAPSRGRIIPDFLRSDQTAAEYLKNLKRAADLYNGFNLLLADGDQLFYYSNITDQIQKLKPGIYGLSNHLLDSDWPKVNRGKMLFQQCLDSNAELDRDKLFTLLADSSQPPDAMLPETGVGVEWERILSPLFIHSRDYGTRSSAIIGVTDDGEIHFDELSYEHGSEVRAVGRKCFALNV